MGKSDVERLPSNSIHLSKLSNQPAIKLCESENQDFGIMMSNVTTNFEAMENQVAGHMNDGKHIGMLVQGDKVYKPISKPQCGQRETMFYNELNNSTDDTLVELRQFIPKYFGNETVTIADKKVECIVLEDLTRNLKEPCIMDIKIGKRTWDPMASYEKIVKEEQKYHETKRDLGFCITGFQVHKVVNGALCKYGKDFGKKLDKDTVREAIKTFLNADVSLNRMLLVQLLAILWKIQNWSRKQRKLRLYSSSLLLMYDARRLRQYLGENGGIKVKPTGKITRSNSLYRPLSLAVLNGNEIPTGFSGQLTNEGPNLRSPTSLRVDLLSSLKETPEKQRKKSVTSLKRTHSFQNNYDKDLQNLKRDYTYLLDDLVTEQKNDFWVNVKMIDFAHVFPAEHCDVDLNYLKGIESLVKIFEDCLVETNSS